MEQEQTPQEITSLVGREVYSSNGLFVGEVEDIRLTLDEDLVTGLALTQVNTEVLGDVAVGTDGVVIPYRWVRAVGDVVLVNDLVERIAAEDDETEAVA